MFNFHFDFADVIDFVDTSNLQNICVTDPSSKSGINDPEKLLEGVLSQVTGYIEGGCKNEANVL